MGVSKRTFVHNLGHLRALPLYGYPTLLWAITFGNETTFWPCISKFIQMTLHVGTFCLDKNHVKISKSKLIESGCITVFMSEA